VSPYVGILPAHIPKVAQSVGTFLGNFPLMVKIFRFSPLGVKPNPSSHYSISASNWAMKLWTVEKECRLMIYV
jgi:hypothetical protein